MTRFRRLLYLGLVLLGTQLSTGCYLGLTNRTVLFPGVAYPAGQGLVNAGSGCCYGNGSGCGTSLLSGPAITGGPVYGAPMYGGAPSYGGASYGGPVYGGHIDHSPSVVGPGYDVHHGGTPGCATCAGGIPISGVVGGPPIAVSPPAGVGGVPVLPAGGGAGIPQVMPSGPIHGVPYDSSIVPTVKVPGTDPKVTDTKKMVAGK